MPGSIRRRASNTSRACATVGCVTKAPRFGSSVTRPSCARRGRTARMRARDTPKIAASLPRPAWFRAAGARRWPSPAARGCPSSFFPPRTSASEGSPTWCASAAVVVRCRQPWCAKERLTRVAFIVHNAKQDWRQKQPGLAPIFGAGLIGPLAALRRPRRALPGFSTAGHERRLRPRDSKRTRRHGGDTVAADVGIRGGRVVALGHELARGRDEIDAPRQARAAGRRRCPLPPRPADGARRCAWPTTSRPARARRPAAARRR